MQLGGGTESRTSSSCLDSDRCPQEQSVSLNNLGKFPESLNLVVGREKVE